MNNALYNTDAGLWNNLLESYARMPNGGAVLAITDDGHVYEGVEAIGRFADRHAAIATLESVGFTKDSLGWKAR